MVSFRELARRLVAEGVVASISHQRVSQLSRDDPAFPPWFRWAAPRRSTGGWLAHTSRSGNRGKGSEPTCAISRQAGE